METTSLNVRLPADLHARLRRSADAHERSLQGEIVYALRRYVERAREVRTTFDWETEPEEETRRAWEGLAGETLAEPDDWGYTPAEEALVARMVREAPAGRRRARAAR
ncbi:MAG TPA: hypothetical protein VFX49_19005 [Chloroflexota bacterium]|nr:hypothetical protein [Chloroflexota bacterium]